MKRHSPTQTNTTPEAAQSTPTSAPRRANGAGRGNAFAQERMRQDTAPAGASDSVDFSNWLEPEAAVGSAEEQGGQESEQAPAGGATEQGEGGQATQDPAELARAEANMEPSVSAGATETEGLSDETAAQGEQSEEEEEIAGATEAEAEAAGMEGEEEEPQQAAEQEAEQEAADEAGGDEAPEDAQPGEGDTGDGEAPPAAAGPNVPAAPAAGGGGSVQLQVKGGAIFPAVNLGQLGIDTKGMTDDDQAALVAMLEQDRALDESMGGGFLAAGATKGAQLAGLGEVITSRIEAAAAQARSSVAAQVAQQQQAVRAAVSQAADQARARAETVRAAIDTRLATALATIDSETEATRATLLSGRDGALSEVDGLLASQTARIEGLYAEADAAYRAAGAAIGAEAMSAAQGRAATFRSQRINRNDSFMDGPLTDNRCEARAEAAVKVGEGYRTGLAEEGGKQANQAMLNKQRDLDAAGSTADAAREQITALFDDLSTTLDTSAASSRSGAEASAAASKGALDGSLQAALGQLSQHESSQIASLGQAGGQASASITSQAAQAIASLQAALGSSMEELGQALQGVRDELASSGLPDPEQLRGGMDEATSAFNTTADNLQAAIEGAIGDAVSALQRAASGACAGLAQAGSQAVTAAQGLGATALQTLDQVGEQAQTGLETVEADHRTSLETAATQGTNGFSQLTAGVRTAFDDLAARFEAGKTSNIEALSAGLRGAFGDMHQLITTEANAAAAKVQPRWKKALKILIIIAVIVVVAVVLAPMVIGAVAGAAAALGASAATATVVGAVVGGAIVGAVAGGTTTIISNVFDGNPWHQGVGQAIAVGAVTGAIGGGIGAATTSMTTGAQVAIGTAADVSMDTVVNFATGNLSWENFGIALAGSLLGAGISTRPKIQAFQANLQAGGARFGNTAFGGSGHVPGVTDINLTTPAAGNEGVDVTPTFADTTPTVDATPTVDTTPTVDATPAVDTTPVVNTTPVADTTPAVDTTPALDTTPGVDTTPAVDTPSADTTPTLDTPSADTTPTIDTPTVNTPTVDSTPTVDATPTVDGPTTDTTPTTDSTPSVDATPSRPPTGAQMAQDAGWPPAPDGYSWVRNPRGDAPFLRRHSGRGADGYPPLRFDADQGAFVHAETGLTFRTPADVDAYVEVLSTPHGTRPAPETYLDPALIDAHLDAFRGGASYLTPQARLDRYGRNPVGHPDGQFVSTAADIDAIVAQAGGDITKIEEALGILPGTWEGPIVRVDIPDPSSLNLRMPSGNEPTANELWLPGGRIPEGQMEAVIDAIPEGSFTETVVAGGTP